MALVIVAPACWTATVSAHIAAARASSEVATYAGNNSRTGSSTNPLITRATALRLSRRWHISVTSPVSDQPIVYSGVVYWGDWNGNLHAATIAGKRLWSTYLGQSPRPATCPLPFRTMGIESSPTVARFHGQTRIWVGGGAGQLVSLDATTGKIVWERPLGTPPDYVLWSSPALYHGSLYEGVASWNDCPGIQGGLYRVDAATGALQASYRPSAPPGCLGAGIWSSPSIDSRTNSVYVTTSNNFVDVPGGFSHTPQSIDLCQSPYQDAIIRLNATRLSVTSHWQVPTAQQILDSDFGASPMLFTAKVRGARRELLGAEDKNGIYYVLDRNHLTAGPIWHYGTHNQCENISTSAWTGDHSLVIVAGSSVKGSTCVGTLAALDPATGRARWRVDLPGLVLGAVTQAPGVVAIGAGRDLDVVAMSNGRKLFSYRESRTSAEKPPVEVDAYPPYLFWGAPTIAGNILLAVNEDGNLWAFRPTEPASRIHG